MKRWNETLVAAAVAALAALPQGASAQDKIIYGIPGPATSAVANLTFAMELGFFADEKITVEMVPLAGSGVIIPQLLSGQIHISGASIDPLIVARQPGKPNFPLKFVYNLNRNMVWEFAVMKNSKVQSIADLKGGAVIGVSSLAANNIPHQAMLRTSGVDLKSVTFQAVGIGVPAYEALRTNQVQVLGLWDVTHAAIEGNGGDIRRLPIPPEFRGRSSHGFEVSDKFLAEKPDLIARFGRAAAMGTVACAANHVGCLKAFWKRYPELKPKTGSEDEIVRREVKVMLARLDNQTYFAPGAKKQWGAFDEQDWKHLIGLLKEGGAIATTDIPLDSLYTNKLVPEFNRFDEAAVVKKAKAYQ